MTNRRKLIYATLALVIAFVAQSLWTTLFNPLVWHLTYVGIHVAGAIHQPDYDSAVSARVFDWLAILINALIYFSVLLALDRLVVRRSSRRSGCLGTWRRTIQARSNCVER
jgi:hypothetical protein